MEKSLKDLNDSEYRELPLESFSSLKYMLESPDIFRHYKENKFKGNSSTLLGTAVHHFLQGNQRLVGVNPYNRVTKQGKIDFESYQIEFNQLTNSEGIIITKSQEEIVKQIFKNYSNNDTLSQLMSEAEYEVPFIKNLNGLDVKGKVDGLAKDKSYLIEIKTTSQTIGLDTFRDQARLRHYDAQAALYQLGLTEKISIPHYFIVCQTTAPFEVKLYRALPTSNFMIEGIAKVNKMISEYIRYILNNEEYIAMDVEDL